MDALGGELADDQPFHATRADLLAQLGRTGMTDALAVPELPFLVTPSQPDVWSRDEEADAVVANAPGSTDLYTDPSGTADHVEATLDAPMLVGAPPAGDFRFSARVTVDFAAQYDAGVLMVWIDDRHWAKFCFEYSPANEPMVVSVVTRDVSDDANATVVDGRSLWMRVARIDHVYAFHSSTDGRTWDVVRVFTLGGVLAVHEIGFEAQSPTGDGCTVTFDSIRFVPERLADLRNGS